MDYFKAVIILGRAMQIQLAASEYELNSARNDRYIDDGGPPRRTSPRGGGYNRRGGRASGRGKSLI